jgi:3-deoxy-D-manno-octulosonic acid kinase
MATPAVPAGYALERERGVQIVALPSVMGWVRAAVDEAGTLYDWAATRPDARPFTGRGRAWGVCVAGDDWVVRHYRRGGAAARLLDDTYLRVGEPRPLRELRASVAARARGVASPEVLAAVIYPAGVSYRADLATRYVRDSADLAETVLGDNRSDAAARVLAWRCAGALLRAAFAAGVEHADLNLRNILIAHTASGPQALLLDLDRAVVRDRSVGDVARRRMLERLHRSRRKLEGAVGRRTSAAELAAFDAAVGAAEHATPRDTTDSRTRG